MARPYKIKRHKRIYRRSAGSILARAAAIISAVVVLFGLGWALYGPVSDCISQKQNGPTEQQEMVPAFLSLLHSRSNRRLPHRLTSRKNRPSRPS